jgi:hypothetical protein
MSQLGQTRKYSQRADVFRFVPESGHPSGRRLRPLGATKDALLTLQFQLAHEIAFSKRRARLAEDVVSRGCMEKEVR